MAASSMHGAATNGGAHRVVVVGGGFGGLHVARGLKRAPVRVVLVDRRNFHLFQPLLYQVATGSLSPANICAPLRWVLRRNENVEVVLGHVVDFDVAERAVVLRDGRLPYDTLVVAAGSRYNYFGHREWPAIAPSLKSIEDAIEVRRRVLLAFEAAEREADAQARCAWLTFVIVGAGPTGVELAGALAEIALHTMKRDFRHIDPREARIVLVEGLDRVLSNYPPELSEKARRALEELGVETRTRCLVTELSPESVRVACGGAEETLRAKTILWTAGVRGSPLAERLAAAAGAELDRAGRIVVDEHLCVPAHPEIFVLGDMARAAGRDGEPLPGMAPVAIQQGKYVARAIRRRLAGPPARARTARGESAPFRYKDRGSMATIGRSKAVADLGRAHFDGFLAWLIWLLVHLMQIVTFQNRVLVLVQWAWHYVTFNRSARLITGEDPALEDDVAEPRVPTAASAAPDRSAARTRS